MGRDTLMAVLTESQQATYHSGVARRRTPREESGMRRSRQRTACRPAAHLGGPLGVVLLRADLHAFEGEMR
jgi:hypothetical protein